MSTPSPQADDVRTAPFRGQRRVPPGLLLASLPWLIFLAAPLLSLVARSISPATLERLAHDALLTQAIWLSLVTTTASLGLVVLFGTPVAYLLARHPFPGRGLVDTLVDLPTVLPPAVAGLALLMSFGRRGVLGPLISAAGFELAFTTAAVVLAQCFVSAPFYIRAARAGFEDIAPELEEIAATEGASAWQTFRHVTVPLALPGLLGGAVMAWARALGEFGATIMFAGNIAGRTQTLPLAIYTTLERDLDTTLAMALLLLLVSWGLLVALRAAASRARLG